MYLNLLILILLLVWAPHNGYSAEVKRFIMEKPDKTIKIVTYKVGAKDTIAEVMRDQAKISGVDVKDCVIVPIEENEIPFSKADIEYRRLNKTGLGPKIVIDEIAKQQDIDAKTLLENKKKAAIQKAGLTEEQFKDLFYGNVPTSSKEPK